MLGADITQVHKHNYAFTLYVLDGESDRVQNNLSWDELRQQLKAAKLKEECKCKRCVWADKSSGYILCTRIKCVKTRLNNTICERNE